MIAVATHETLEVDDRVLPERIAVELRAAVRRPVRRLVENAETELVRDVMIEARIDLRVQTHRIAVRRLDRREPRPRIATRHLRNAHEVPRVALELDLLAVEAVVRALDRPLAPAEALDLAVDRRAVRRKRHREEVEVRMRRRPRLERVLRNRNLNRHNFLRLRRDLNRADRLRELRRADFPRRDRCRKNIRPRAVEPLVDVRRKLRRRRRVARVRDRHVERKCARGNERTHIDVRNLQLRAREERDVLPDADDLTAPHRTRRNHATADARAILEELLSAHADHQLERLARLHGVRHVDLKRQEELKVPRQLPAVDEHDRLTRDRLEMEDDALVGPVRRHRDGPLEPAHLHVAPRIRIRREVAVVWPLALTEAKVVDVPGGRNLDLRRRPALGRRHRQLRGLALPVLPALRQVDGLEVPAAVQTDLGAKRPLEPVHEALGRRKHVIEANALRNAHADKRRHTTRESENNRQTTDFNIHHATILPHPTVPNRENHANIIVIQTRQTTRFAALRVHIPPCVDILAPTEHCPKQPDLIPRSRFHRNVHHT